MPFRPPTQHAITPQGQGLFPGFDVLDQAHMWDDVTAGVVLARLSPPNMLSYFTPQQMGIAQPMLDLLLGQDGEPRVPVLALIDARLAAGETDGWHYDDMPEDGHAWCDTLAHLDGDAHTRHDTGYAALGRADQARQACLESVDPVCLCRVLLPSVGVERDRLQRSRLPARLPQCRDQRPREMGGRRPR
jgi:hypothetical protein